MQEQNIKHAAAMMTATKIQTASNQINRAARRMAMTVEVMLWLFLLGAFVLLLTPALAKDVKCDRWQEKGRTVERCDYVDAPPATQPAQPAPTPPAVAQAPRPARAPPPAPPAYQPPQYVEPLGARWHGPPASRPGYIEEQEQLNPYFWPDQ
jgi:hypothetical protein